MDETNIHAAEKSDRAGLRSLGSEYSNQIRTFMLFKNQGGDVGQLTNSIDDRKVNVRIILRDLFHDRRLCKANSDDQIEVPLGKFGYRRFNCVRRSGFDVP